MDTSGNRPLDIPQDFVPKLGNFVLAPKRCKDGTVLWDNSIDILVKAEDTLVGKEYKLYKINSVNDLFLILIPTFRYELIEGTNYRLFNDGLIQLPVDELLIDLNV